MSSDKILLRIQLHINELTPTLELFVDTNIQPSVQDCENLQKQLSSLQENLPPISQRFAAMARII